MQISISGPAVLYCGDEKRTHDSEIAVVSPVHAKLGQFELYYPNRSLEYGATIGQAGVCTSAEKLAPYAPSFGEARSSARPLPITQRADDIQAEAQ